MIRTDFVSNSSSSSFVLKTKMNMMDKNTYEKFLRFFTSGNELDKYNVIEYLDCIHKNVVFSIFEFVFLTDFDNECGKYSKCYNMPPMEFLDKNCENIDNIIDNIFKDCDGGFETDGSFFYHEDFVFSHRGIAVINKESIEYTRKILNMAKKDFSFKFGDSKYCIIYDHINRVKGKDDYLVSKKITIKEAEDFLDKLENELKDNIQYIVIAMSYQGDGTDYGKLWYDKDFDKEKSCYKLIEENNFGETFYIDW